MCVGIRVLGHLLFFMLGLMMDWCLFGRVSLLTFSHSLFFNFLFFFQSDWSYLQWLSFTSSHSLSSHFFSFCPAVECFFLPLNLYSAESFIFAFFYHVVFPSLSLSRSLSFNLHASKLATLGILAVSHTPLQKQLSLNLLLVLFVLITDHFPCHISTFIAVLPWMLILLRFNLILLAGKPLRPGFI